MDKFAIILQWIRFFVSWHGISPKKTYRQFNALMKKNALESSFRTRIKKNRLCSTTIYVLSTRSKNQKAERAQSALNQMTHIFYWPIRKSVQCVKYSQSYCNVHHTRLSLMTPTQIGATFSCQSTLSHTQRCVPARLHIINWEAHHLWEICELTGNIVEWN